MVDQSKVINVQIAFLNLDATESLKSYATDKVTHSVQKFCQRDTEVHVVLKVEKNRQIAEVTLHSGGADFTVKEESDNLYASIDAMVDTLTHQLRKHKEKVTSHH
jgi:putative sigma-54 modulation protein